MESTPSPLGQLSDSLAAAVDTAAAAAVTVNARRRMPSTGIVWSENGLIVTAQSTVERDDDLTVGLPDGRTVAATLIGRDAGSDIALLQANADGLTPAVRDGAQARPGHLVLAIGRPGPSGPMASFGVISMVGGPLRGPQGGGLERFIRADIAMLPGFSGGPLVDAAGVVIGMNTSHLSRGGGLTVPAESIEHAVDALRAHGRIRRGYLGIAAQSVPLCGATRSLIGRDQAHALMVLSVNASGPADKAGLMQGDVIVGVAGTPVGTVEELQNKLTSDYVGCAVPVTIARAGIVSHVDVTVAERPETTAETRG